MKILGPQRDGDDEDGPGLSPDAADKLRGCRGIFNALAVSAMFVVMALVLYMCFALSSFHTPPGLGQ